MRYQLPEGSGGLGVSGQSSAVTSSLGSQPSHRSASDSNLETSPEHLGTRLPSHPQIPGSQPIPDNLGAPGSPPMSAGLLSSDNPQMDNDQQIPNHPPEPEIRQTNHCPPTHSYPPAHCYPYERHPSLTPHYQPPDHDPQMAPNRHPLSHSQEYCSPLPYPFPGAGTADEGLDLSAPQTNTEPSNPPIPRYSPPNYQGTDTRDISPAQTQMNCPVGPHIFLAGNSGHEEPDKDIQSPNVERLAATPPISYSTPPAYTSAGPPLSSTVIPLTDNQEKEVIIAVMGATGTGKSYFIREVSGISDVEVSSSLRSCTTKVQPHSFPYGTSKITLVDTPGFNDSNKSDTEVLSGICDWMSSNYKKGKLLSGIIYLHRITDVRMDGTSLKNLKMFQRMCGKEALRNVLLTTTQWSNVNPALGKEREGNLQHKDFWAEILLQGASLERFMGTRESGLGLIDKLVENKPKPLRIQDEMAKGMAVLETDAGKFMNEELISLQKKYEEDLGNLERERQNAIKEKDGEMEMILAQEQSNAREKRGEAAAEMKLLAGLHQAQVGKLEVLRKEREKEDRAVIAVATKDTSITAHLMSMATSCNTKGRLIYDIDDLKEFVKEPINITIDYQSGIFARIGEVLDAGTGTDMYINHHGALYQCNTHDYIKRGSQNFVIFKKALPGGA